MTLQLQQLNADLVHLIAKQACSRHVQAGTSFTRGGHDLFPCLAFETMVLCLKRDIFITSSTRITFKTFLSFVYQL